MGNKLAVQMFTVRDFTKTAADLAVTLDKIAAIGYKAVQVSAVGCINDGSVSAAGVKKMLDERGLACIATHRGFDQFTKDVAGEVAFHKALGCDYTAIGGLFGDKPYPQTVAGYRQFLSDAKPVIAELKRNGIRFGHHNHAHEFFRPELGGPRLYDIIIDEGGADLMIEMDLFWAWHGGASPVQMLKRCLGRIDVIHLKDKAFYYAENNPHGIAPIGEGNMPWDEIIPECEKMGVKWYCIEHDTCPRDPFDCLKSSYNYLSGRFGLK